MTITKNWYARPLYLALALVLALGMALPAVATANADVTDPAVTLGVKTISTATSYTFDFRVHADLVTAGTVFIKFPKDTKITAAAVTGVQLSATSGLGTDAFIDVPVTATAAAAATDGTTTVTVTVPAAGAGIAGTMNTQGNIGATAYVRVAFTGTPITNPSTVADYTSQIRTSAEATWVATPTYTTTVPPLAGEVRVYNAGGALVEVSISMATAMTKVGTNAGYTVEVAPGTFGAFTVQAATGLTIKATGTAAETIVTGAVTVNGQATIEGMTFKGGVTVTNNIAATKNTVTLKDCVLSATTGTLLDLTKGAITVDGCTVNTVNTATKTPIVGIDVAAAIASVTITGCTFTTDAGDTAAVNLTAVPTKATVKDSTFSGAGNAGIKDTVGGVTVTISGNTFDGLKQAIVTAASTLTIKDNVIKNCTTKLAGAIALTGAVKVTVTNNKFTDNAGYALAVTTNGDKVKMLFNDLSGNVLTVNNDAVAKLDASHNSWDVAPTANDTTKDITYLPVVSSSSSGGTVAIVATTLTAKTTAGVDVTANGAAAGTIAAARLAANPGTATPYTALADGYYDIYLDTPSGTTTTVTVKLYNDAVTDNTLAYAWSSLQGAWVKCDTQGANTFGGFVYATLKATTTPAIADLDGLGFALVAGPAPVVVTPVVALSTPKDGTTDMAINTIPFTWNSVAGADSYIWQLSTDAVQTVWLDRQALTSTAYTYSVIDLDYETPYYWKVTAGTGLALSKGAIKGTILAVSEVQTFVTGEAPAATVVYTSPYTGDTFTDETAFLAHMNYYDAQQQAQTQPAPSWVWVLIGIGAVLVIVTLVLIFRSRRV